MSAGEESRTEKLQELARALPGSVDLPCINPFTRRGFVDPADDTVVTATVRPGSAANIRARNSFLGLSTITRYEQKKAKQREDFRRFQEEHPPAPEPQIDVSSTRSKDVALLEGDVARLPDNGKEELVDSDSDSESDSGGGSDVGQFDGSASSSSSSSAAAANTHRLDSDAGSGKEEDCAYGFTEFVHATKEELGPKVSDTACVEAERGPLFTLYPGLRIQTWWAKAQNTSAFPQNTEDAFKKAGVTPPCQHLAVSPEKCTATDRAWSMRLIYSEHPLMIDCIGTKQVCFSFYEDVVSSIAKYTRMTKRMIANWLKLAIRRNTSEFFPDIPVLTFDDMFPAHNLRPIETDEDDLDEKKWTSGHRRIFPVTLFPFLYIFLEKLKVGVDEALRIRMEKKRAAASVSGSSSSAAAAAAAAAAASGSGSGSSEKNETQVHPSVATDEERDGVSESVQKASDYVQDIPPWVTTGTSVETVTFFTRLHTLALAIGRSFSDLDKGLDRMWREMVHAQLTANISTAFQNDVQDYQQVTRKMVQNIDRLDKLVGTLRRSSAGVKREGERRMDLYKRKLEIAHQDTSRLAQENADLRKQLQRKRVRANKRRKKTSKS